MLHIVFNLADIDTLQQAMLLDTSIQGEIFQIKDDFAVGPLEGIYTPEGIAIRKSWWKEVLAGGDYETIAERNEVNDEMVFQDIQNRLQNDSTETLWIWAAQNKHDVCGYYWMVSRLQEFQGRIFILYLNNLPFINEKGQLFYPRWLHTIPPREFMKAKKLARLVHSGEFEVDADEWAKLCRDNQGVRLLEGGKKLVGAGYDFYDGDLKKFITPDWQKAGRIIHHFLHKANETTGDAYLLWRLKKLIAESAYDVQGEQKGMKDFEIKTKQAQTTIAEMQEAT